MSKPVYIRARREKTTVFVCFNARDSLNTIKNKLCLALDNKKTTDEIRLLVESKLKGEYTVLDNSKTLENNTMVYFVYFDREEGQWEPVRIVEPELLDDDLEEEVVPAKKEKGKGRA